MKLYKKNSIVFAAFMLLMLLGSCVKNEFEVKFVLPQSVNNTYKITYCASDNRGSVQIETAVNIASGKGVMKCITRNPTAVWIFQGNSPLPAALFFSERGDKIEITGDNQNASEWKISGGGKSNELLQAWRMENKKLIEDVRLANVDMPGDAAERMNKCVATFVEAHSDSPAAAVVLTAYFDSRLNPDKFQKLFELLEKSGIAEEYPLLLSRQDAVTSGEKIGKAKDFVVQSYWRNYDTLRLAGAKAKNFVFLWRRNDKNHDILMDSVKKIAKARKDSSSKLMSDLCLDPDSAMWAYQVKRDSLRNVLRAIAPRGLADSNLMELGVGDTPWFVVTAPGGKILYTGSDFDKASKAFK